MAGFLGWVRTDGGAAGVAEALECLRHHPSFRGEVLAGDGARGVAVLYRPADPPEVVRIPERGVLVAVLGAVLDYAGDRWHRFTAAELAQRYLDRGIAAISGLDGFYQLLVWDEAAGKVHILDDRVGSMWVQHAHTPEGVAFAPEAKALFRLLPLPPTIDFAGMVSFLNLGYPVGTLTLFEGVRLLAPAQRWTVDLRTAAVEQTRTWVQRFEPDRRLTLGGAAELLYEAFLRCAQSPLGRAGQRAWMAMTGGYDSRVLLYLLSQAGEKPELAVTWGATDAEPESDPPVARRLAAAVGLNHRFYRYSAETTAANVVAWGGLSELASDNPGYFAAGSGLLFDHGSLPADGVYIGDVVIASGGLPRTVGDALTTVLSGQNGRLEQSLEQVLRADVARAAGSALWEEVQRVVDDCPSTRPEDVQDFLWTQMYNFRWLFSPGFYKEPLVAARRPLLLGPAYEALTRIPARLRVYRRVYLEMVQRHLSPPFRGPRAEGNSLVDWHYESHHEPSLRGFLQAATSWHTLGVTPIGRILDEAAVTRRVANFFSGPVQPMRRRPRDGTLIALRRRFAAAPLVADALRLGQRVLGGRAGVSGTRQLKSWRLLWRIALVAGLAQAMPLGVSVGELGGRPRGFCA